MKPQIQKPAGHRNFIKTDSFTGLSEHLIAKIYPMKRSESDPTVWMRDDSRPFFSAPLTSCQMELVSNWVSPFENSGAEGSQFSSLSQMLQAGSFLNITNALGARMSEEDRKNAKLLNSMENAAKTMVGRSGVTKTNATSVWAGQAPCKLDISLLLKAFEDPQREVEEPLKLLQGWMMPRHLAVDGVIAGALRDGASVLSLMPSFTPEVVLFTYKNRIIGPCVIERVSDPWDSPIDFFGRRISCVVQATITTLTALDQKDWSKTYVENL